MPLIKWLNTPPEEVPPIYQLRSYADADNEPLVRRFFPDRARIPSDAGPHDASLLIFAASGSWRWHETASVWPQTEVTMSRTEAIAHARRYFEDKGFWDEGAAGARVYTSYTLLSSHPKQEAPVQQRPVAVHVSYRFQVDGVASQGPSGQMQATLVSDSDGPRVVEAYRFWREVETPVAEQLLPMPIDEIERVLQEALRRAKISVPVVARLDLHYLTAPPKMRQEYLAPVLVAEVQVLRDGEGSPALRFNLPAWHSPDDSQRRWFGPLEPVILFPF